MGSRLEVFAYVPTGGATPGYEWVQTYGGSSVVGALRALLRAKWRSVDARLTGGKADAMLGLATTRELLEEIVARLGPDEGVCGPGACVPSGEAVHPAVVVAGRAADTALRSLPRPVLEYRTVDEA